MLHLKGLMTAHHQLELYTASSMWTFIDCECTCVWGIGDFTSECACACVSFRDQGLTTQGMMSKANLWSVKKTVLNPLHGNHGDTTFNSCLFLNLRANTFLSVPLASICCLFELIDQIERLVFKTWKSAFDGYMTISWRTNIQIQNTWRQTHKKRDITV